MSVLNNPDSSRASLQGRGVQPLPDLVRWVGQGVAR